MPSVNVIRIRRYNRLCKRANDLAAAARRRGHPEADQQALIRLERMMEDLNSRIELGPRYLPR